MRVLADDHGPVLIRALRWFARATSLASLGLLAMFAASDGAMPSAFEWLMIAFFPIGVAVGTLVAWRHEILGGAIAAGCLAVFYVLISLDSSRPPAGLWFLVFASPALALLACGLTTRFARPRSAPSSR
jgi:hypothetical protein